MIFAFVPGVVTVRKPVLTLKNRLAIFLTVKASVLITWLGLDSPEVRGNRASEEIGLGTYHLAWP